MFKLANLHNSAPLEIHIEHDGVKIVFNISKIVNTRKSDGIDDAAQFILLNEFIDSKGPQFKADLMRRYMIIDDILMDTIGRGNINPLPFSIVTTILDGKFVTLEEIEDYLMRSPSFALLKKLPEEFNAIEAQDKRFTRVQTYTRSDYRKLAALSTLSKFILGQIGQFGHMNHSTLGADYIDYILFHMIRRHPIFECDAMQKLLGSIKISLDKEGNTQESNIRVIEKNIGKEEIPIWILASSFFKRVATAPIVRDTDDDSTITRFYNYVINFMRNNKDTSRAIRAKRDVGGRDEGGEETVVEMFRMVAELSRGIIEEVRAVVSGLVSDPHTFDPEIDLNVYADAVNFSQRLTTDAFHPAKTSILGMVFKREFHPRMLEHFVFEDFVPLFPLAFAYLWAHDHKYLALAMLANTETDEEVMTLNITSNRSRIPPELKEVLDKQYPLSKPIVGTKSATKLENVAVINIEKIADFIYKYQHRFLASSAYIQDATGSPSSSQTPPGDVKILLAKFVIQVQGAIHV